MPFSTEDKVIIKHYLLGRHYGFKKLLKEFPNKDWTKQGLQYLLRKSDETGDFARIPGSSRTPTSLTNENVEEVEELILSQKENPGTHKSERNIGRIIGTLQSSVSRICRQSLGLTAFRKTKVKDLSDADKLKKVIRCKRLLRFRTVANVNKTFFTDKKLFKLKQPRNAQTTECMPQERGDFF